MEEHLTSDLHFKWGLVLILYSTVSGRSTSQTFMYAGENELCDYIIEYPAIMGTANVGTLKLFSSRCAEYEKFKVFFSNPSDCYPRRNSKFKMIKT